MTIGIDARFFGPKGKGLGRYTQKLIEELQIIDRENQYVIFLRQANWDDYQPSSQRFTKVLADYKWYTLAEQIFMPIKISQAKVDLMHFPHFNVPIFYFGKYLVTIHDLILRRFATRRASTRNILVYFFKNLAYRFVIWLAIKKAEKIITVSEFVKEDIKKIFKVEELKIIVTLEGVSELKGNTVDADSVLRELGIKKPFLLYVGNAYPHKNLERLLEAFSLVAQEKNKLQLVLVGEEDYFYQRLKKEADAFLFSNKEIFGRIIFTGFVEDNKLWALYKNASLYVFPSLCEGFGLPPLEAMAYGLPVVSSRESCLPEILGDAVVYFSPLDSREMAQKIDGILDDEVSRWVLIRKGVDQVKKYSWRRMAEETLDLYLGA